MIREELLELSPEALIEKSKELHAEQMGLQFQKALQQLEGTHRLGQVRKSIAQVKTLMREYELGIRKREAK